MRAKFPIFVISLCIFVLIISMFFMSISSVYTRKSPCFKTDAELQKAHGWSMWYDIILAFALVSAISVAYIYVKWTSGSINWSENTTSLTVIIVLGFLLLFLLLGIIISSAINSIYINHSKCKDEDIKEAYKWSNICCIFNSILFAFLGIFIVTFIWKEYQEKVKKITGEMPREPRRRGPIHIEPIQREKTSEELVDEVFRAAQQMKESRQRARVEQPQATTGEIPSTIPDIGPAIRAFHQRQMEQVYGPQASAPVEGEFSFPKEIPPPSREREIWRFTPGSEAERQAEIILRGDMPMSQEEKSKLVKADVLMKKYPYLEYGDMSDLIELHKIAPSNRSKEMAARINYLQNPDRYLKDKYGHLGGREFKELKDLLMIQGFIRDRDPEKKERVKQLKTKAREAAQEAEILGAFTTRATPKKPQQAQQREYQFEFPGISSTETSTPSVTLTAPPSTSATTGAREEPRKGAGGPRMKSSYTGEIPTPTKTTALKRPKRVTVTPTKAGGRGRGRGGGMAFSVGRH